MSYIMALFGCASLPPPDLKNKAALTDPRYFGTKDKSLAVDMLCFQQRATQYLKYYKEHKLYMPD